MDLEILVFIENIFRRYTIINILVLNFRETNVSNF